MAWVGIGSILIAIIIAIFFGLGLGEFFDNYDVEIKDKNETSQQQDDEVKEVANSSESDEEITSNEKEDDFFDTFKN
jgi:hypothetical protein